MRLFTSLFTLVTGIFLSSSALAEMATPDMLTNTCVACHGENGISQGPAIPSLAGMTENYFIGAMLAYKYDDNPAELEKALDELNKDEKYAEAEALKRFGTIMGRIAKGYTLEEIKAMAPVFSRSTHTPVMQGFDKSKVALGQDLHEEYCDKCHEDGGLSPEDDVGILAGQWLPYLKYTFDDYYSGKREMPKKMKKAMQAVSKSQGKDGIESLLQYYASIK